MYMFILLELIYFANIQLGMLSNDYVKFPSTVYMETSSKFDFHTFQIYQ